MAFWARANAMEYQASFLPPIEELRHRYVAIFRDRRQLIAPESRRGQRFEELTKSQVVRGCQSESKFLG